MNQELSLATRVNGAEKSMPRHGIYSLPLRAFILDANDQDQSTEGCCWQWLLTNITSWEASVWTQLHCIFNDEIVRTNASTPHEEKIPSHCI